MRMSYESPLMLKRDSPTLLLWPTDSTLFSPRGPRVFFNAWLLSHGPRHPYRMTSHVVLWLQTQVAPIKIGLNFFLSPYLSSTCSPSLPVRFSNVLSLTTVLLRGSTPGTLLLPCAFMRPEGEVYNLAAPAPSTITTPKFSRSKSRGTWPISSMRPLLQSPRRRAGMNTLPPLPRLMLKWVIFTSVTQHAQLPTAYIPGRSVQGSNGYPCLKDGRIRPVSAFP